MFQKTTRTVTAVLRTQKTRFGKLVVSRQESPVVSWWFRREVAATLLTTLPDLTGHPDLAVGDLLFDHTPFDFRFYIWLPTSQSGLRSWQPIFYGHKRGDGKRLIVTDGHEPAWVSEEFYQDLLVLDGSQP